MRADMCAQRAFPRLIRLVVTMLALLASAAPAQAKNAEHCFPKTGFCISGRIRDFWDQNGGLPVFGYPITAQAKETSNGGSFQTQWFERARLELHPENKPPYDVLLGRLGADMLAKQGRDWFTFPKADATTSTNCHFFKETGHSVCGEFHDAYTRFGLDLGQKGTSFAENLALFGLPLSEAMTETVENGKQFTVQWFERGRFELHPENQPPYRVLFGRLGADLHGTLFVTPPPPLAGTTWLLDSFGALTMPHTAADLPAPLAFGSDARISGSTGCNNFGGAYAASATEIRFGQIVSTLEACSSAAGTKQEAVILHVLQGTVRYTRSADKLQIFYNKDQSALTYHAQP